MADRRADDSPPSGLCFPPAVHAHSGWSPKTAQGVPLGYPLRVFAPTPSPAGSGVVNALFTRRDPMHRRGRGLNASPPRLIGCPNYFRRGWLPIRLTEWVRGDEYLRQNKNYIKVLRGLGCFFKSTPRNPRKMKIVASELVSLATIISFYIRNVNRNRPIFYL